MSDDLDDTEKPRVHSEAETSASDPSLPAIPGRIRPKRLSKLEWAEIRELWELDQATITELSATYGVTASLISDHFKRYRVTRGSRKGEVSAAISKKIVTAVAGEKAATFASMRSQRIEETKNQSYQLDAVIAKMMAGILTETAKAGVPLATRLDDLKSLRIAAQINAQTREGRYVVLDAAQETSSEGLPEIVFRDLSQEDIRKIQTQIDEDFDLSDLLDEPEDETGDS